MRRRNPRVRAVLNCPNRCRGEPLCFFCFRSHWRQVLPPLPPPKRKNTIRSHGRANRARSPCVSLSIVGGATIAAAPGRAVRLACRALRSIRMSFRSAAAFSFPVMGGERRMIRAGVFRATESTCAWEAGATASGLVYREKPFDLYARNRRPGSRVVRTNQRVPAQARKTVQANWAPGRLSRGIK